MLHKLSAWNQPGDGASHREDRMKSRVVKALAVAAAGFVATSALAADTIKIAYIDPLSGGGASIGEVGLKHFQYIADQLNAKGGVLGMKVEVVAYDNKLNPQESLIQVQKAI